MIPFKVVLLSHDYASTDIEREIVERAGGQLLDADCLPEAERLPAAEEADAVIVRWMAVTPEIIRRWRRCRIIIRYGVGYDNVHYDAATAAGIMIGHCPHYCLDEVATHALALLLGCIRGIPGTHVTVAQGGWDPNPLFCARRVAGRTLGIVGLGNIGGTLARKLGGWGLRLLANDPFVEPECAVAAGVTLVDFETLLRESDYISLHVPLLPETHHLINERAFGLMKPGVILVNTSRGPVVDEKALRAALNDGPVATAGLDVFEQEPLPAESPLRRHPRLLLSNHAAWYSEDALAELHRSVAEDAVRVCTGGLPVALANPEVLHKLGRFKEWTPTWNARWRWRRAEQLNRETRSAAKPPPKRMEDRG
jgi:D-3-phosphoglycerate dehydrogenase / 2-oxoglutarate reductase